MGGHFDHVSVLPYTLVKRLVKTLGICHGKGSIKPGYLIPFPITIRVKKGSLEGKSELVEMISVCLQRFL